MVLLGRIELPTSALPRMRSTTELQQPTIPGPRTGYETQRAAGARYWLRVRGLSSIGQVRQGQLAMADDQGKTSREAGREERLAAKLRENLRRRKAQARNLADKGEAGTNSGLSKEPAKS